MERYQLFDGVAVGHPVHVTQDKAALDQAVRVAEQHIMCLQEVFREAVSQVGDFQVEALLQEADSQEEVTREAESQEEVIRSADFPGRSDPGRLPYTGPPGPFSGPPGPFARHMVHQTHWGNGRAWETNQTAITCGSPQKQHRFFFHVYPMSGMSCIGSSISATCCSWSHRSDQSFSFDSRS